ncbi:YqaA family protein [Lacibacterium aquatile]|uniref:YqaA family protein n=1 Tax=Lacibacterium aquatile TaxID=1168082 RepID=A0ABW5DUE2_9PROT
MFDSFMTPEVGGIALFFGTMLAATIFPVSSEAMLAAAIHQKLGGTVELVLIATIGNTVGCWLNWLTGRFLYQYRDRRWFPVSDAALQRARTWFNRWGLTSLLFSWIPIVGDPLTVIAGILKVNLYAFLFLTATGRALRYCVIAGLLAE